MFDASYFVPPVEGFPLMARAGCGLKGKESYQGVVADLG